ncbi:sialate O-acetylesterase [Danxiaibacter flavus]|uniref:Sialate O-acetylesterase n=1 Tax=Danxiaibacter flavus TaxID=3049108 RepID=A0ABV3ZAL2_9BACT|nr:sialate O-acetylesterase [Chitinophagaceae bacterium DXS]
MKKIFTIALSAIGITSSYANIKLPSVISSNMVLQQKSAAKLWGWCSPGEKIYITTSWDNKTDSTKGTRDANWQLAIQTPAAGGPFTITIKGSNTITLDNVMSGEVWVCSGQSNMEWGYQQGLQQVKDELPACYNKNIRFFNIPKTTSLHPQDDCNAKWEICDSNSLKYFSAIGYFFGKKLNQDINVPVGLVNSNWGGTPAEVWTPEELVTGSSSLQTAANKINPSDWWPYKPGYTYNAMIAPLVNFPIAGAIWYQGESNTGTASTYSQLFTTMIDGWRKAWNKEFPFYYVQIAPFKYGDKNVGALLREAQANSITHNKVGMVVVTDLVADTNNIHPIDKKNVALRLANWALAETYAQSVNGYKSPMFKSLNVNNGKAFVTFQYADNGLVSKDKKITELTVAGDDKVFYPAEAKIENGQLVVWSPSVKNPVAVRYGFSNTAMGNLFSKDGLPVCPFRTDSWDVDTSHN